MMATAIICYFLPYPIPLLPSKNTFLWRLSSPDLQGDSYVFGTMHVQDARAFSQLDLVKSCILQCDSFAAEYHLEEQNQADSHQMLLPDGLRLKDLISTKKFEKLHRILLKSTGLNLLQFQHLSPFMLTGLIGAQLLGREMPVSLDAQLWAFAKAAGKQMEGVETFEEQLAVLGKISLKQQVEMLLALGKNIKRFRQHTLHSAELYQRGALGALSKSVVKKSGKLRKLMVYQRNEIMAERIAQRISETRFFAAIGAGHLGGGKGVLRLLKQKGINIAPVHSQ